MKKYLFIIKTQIIKSLTYEFNVYGNILMQTYIIISSALSVILIIGVERRIGRSVEKGTVATDMTKPISLFGMFFHFHRKKQSKMFRSKKQGSTIS